MTKVAVLSSAFVATSSIAGDLKKKNIELIAVDRNLDREQLIQCLLECEAVIAGTERYSATLLKQLPNLKLIARTGVGTDGIDLDAAKAQGVEIFVTPGLNSDAVAEHAIALLLAVLHRVVYLDTRVRRGLWRDGRGYRQISGLRLGVIGFGQVGKRVARLAVALGAEVRGFDPHQENDVLVSTLEELLRESDALSIHVPLTRETRHLIGIDELSHLPSGAVLVNTSRGGVVDEDALYGALVSGDLAGAALDVFEQEPVVPGNRFISLENVVLSPHISSLSSEAINSMSEAIAKKIRGVLSRG